MKINGRSFSDYEPGKTFALDLPAHSLSSPGLSPSLDFTEVQHRLIRTSDVCDPVSEATQTNRQHRFPHGGGKTQVIIILILMTRLNLLALDI